MANWFNKARKRADDTDLKNPKAWLLAVLGGETASGVKVNQETALKFSAVWAAVSLRSSLIASFPKQVFEKSGNTKTEINDDIHKLIAYRPNPYMNAFTFWELNNTYLDLWGNAYNIITWSKKKPIGLTPVHPSKVEVKLSDKGIPYYQISEVGKGVDGNYKAQNILHFKDLSLDGLVGKSKIMQAKESIGLGLAAEKFGSEFFGKGGHSEGVLEMDSNLGDEAYETFQKRWSKNANHGVPLLEYGIKYKQITIPPEAAQFIATRQFQLQDVARTFGVPPHLLADLSRATFSNIEHSGQQFVQYFMRPTVERYEHEIETKLMGDKLGEKFARFNLDDLLRGDMTARANYYSSAIAATWMSPNEARAKENMNPRDGGDTYENPNTNTNNNGTEE